jgi:hypothetical protein
LLFIGLLIYASVTYHYDRISKKGSRHTLAKSIDHEYQPDNAFETYRIPSPQPVSHSSSVQTDNDFFNIVVKTSAPSNVYTPGSHHNNSFGNVISAANDYGQRQMRPNIDTARSSSSSSYSRFYHSPEFDDECSQGDGLRPTASGKEACNSYQRPVSSGSSLNSLLMPPIVPLARGDYIVSRQLLSDEQAKMYWQRQRMYEAALVKGMRV